MTAIGLLIALVRYGRRADLPHVIACAVIGALAHEADKDYVEQLARARDGRGFARIEAI